ncbi:MAG TPA: TonB family protein [Pyrinomonadaceae bacterium]
MTRDTTHTTLRGAAAAAALSLSLLPAGAGAARAQSQSPVARAADAEVERAEKALARGDAAGAVAVLKPVAERRKTDADAWYYLGLALSRADKNKDARKAFEKSLKLRPDSAPARTGLALALLRLGKTRDAAREADRAVSLDPAYGDAHFVAAAARQGEGKYAQALEEAEAALRLRPDFPVAAALAADALLNVYVEESARAAERHPVPPGADEAARRPALAQRDAALAPLRERMRAAADRLAAFAASHADAPAAAEWRETAEMLRVYGGAGAGDNVYRQSEVTTKAIIIFKPEPSFTDAARNHNVSGVVRLRAVLTADGQVRHILVLKWLPDGLTQKAVAAARQIRFTPATRDGVPVSQFVVLEYNFNVY